MLPGPLSQRIADGRSRHSMIGSRARMMRTDGSEKSIPIPKSSTLQPEVSSIRQLIVHKASPHWRLSNVSVFLLYADAFD